MDLLDHALLGETEDLPRQVMVFRQAEHIRSDPVFAQELALCRDLAIPYSRFRSWTEVDQAIALAYEQVRRETCRNCGTRDDEWRETVDGVVRDIDPPPYEPELHSCAGCQTVAAMRDEETDPEPGTTLVLKRTF